MAISFNVSSLATSHHHSQNQSGLKTKKSSVISCDLACHTLPLYAVMTISYIGIHWETSSASSSTGEWITWRHRRPCHSAHYIHPQDVQDGASSHQNPHRQHPFRCQTWVETKLALSQFPPSSVLAVLVAVFAIPPSSSIPLYLNWMWWSLQPNLVSCLWSQAILDALELASPPTSDVAEGHPCSWPSNGACPHNHLQQIIHPTTHHHHPSRWYHHLGIIDHHLSSESSPISVWKLRRECFQRQVLSSKFVRNQLTTCHSNWICTKVDGESLLYIE